MEYNNKSYESFDRGYDVLSRESFNYKADSRECGGCAVCTGRCKV